MKPPLVSDRHTIVVVIAALALGAGLLAAGVGSPRAPVVDEAFWTPSPPGVALQIPGRGGWRTEATRAYQGTYAGTPTPDPTPLGYSGSLHMQRYVVRAGDTLSQIAYAFGCTVEEIVAANGIRPDEIWPGQTLTVPVGVARLGPAWKLVPDSELVYGPAYIHFDLAAFVAEQGGYLARYMEEVEGRSRNGSEIVQMVAQRYSVGPRVLLALLELRAGWVTDPDPPADTLFYPMGSYEPFREGLFEQLSWTAAALNEGYYGWKYGGWTLLNLLDGSRIGVAPGLNAGTVAVQNYLAQVSWGEEWETLVGAEGFYAVYMGLFGNPFAYTVDPLLPEGLVQPELLLPWEAGETWYLTGGPHGGWGRGSGWAALDFAPAGEIGCRPAAAWVTAAAPGLVLRSDYGEVVVDLDGDGHEQSGWVLTYMHIHSEGRVEAGTWVERGQRIGHPSCEGGYADATHLHFARRYNGEWIPVGRDPLPLVLSGWTAHEAAREYDGSMTKGAQIRQACQCSEDEINGLLSDNTPPR